MSNRILVGLNTEDKEIVYREVPSVRLNSRVIAFGKVQVRVFSIGHLAMALGRSTATIRRWQRRGIIPPPICSMPTQERYYLQEEVEVYRRVSRAHDLRTGASIESSGFIRAIHAEVGSLKKRIVAAIEKAGGSVPKDVIQ